MSYATDIVNDFINIIVNFIVNSNVNVSWKQTLRTSVGDSEWARERRRGGEQGSSTARIEASFEAFGLTKVPENGQLA
jgi:hypothetical protein